MSKRSLVTRHLSIYRSGGRGAGRCWAAVRTGTEVYVLTTETSRQCLGSLYLHAQASFMGEPNLKLAVEPRPFGIDAKIRRPSSYTPSFPTAVSAQYLVRATRARLWHGSTGTWPCGPFREVEANRTQGLVSRTTAREMLSREGAEKAGGWPFNVQIQATSSNDLMLSRG